MTAVSNKRLQVLSHPQFELQTSHGTDNVSFGETLFGNHPDPTTVATFRSVFAAALLANRHDHNLITVLTGDSSQLFMRSLQRLAASHASDSLPFSKLATCNIGAFDATVLKHVRRITIFANEARGIASRCINRMSQRQTNTLQILVSADPFPPIKIPKHLCVLHFHLSKYSCDMSPAVHLQWECGKCTLCPMSHHLYQTPPHCNNKLYKILSHATRSFKHTLPRKPSCSAASDTIAGTIHQATRHDCQQLR
jgi:hypothetical protein